MPVQAPARALLLRAIGVAKPALRSRVVQLLDGDLSHLDLSWPEVHDFGAMHQVMISPDFVVNDGELGLRVTLSR